MFFTKLKDSDIFLKEIYNRIPHRIKIAFISSIIFSLLTHLAYFTNHFINHDAIMNLFDDNDVYWLGRWFLKYASWFSSTFDLSFVIGTISIIAIALTVCLTVSLLKIKKITHIVLIAGLFSTFPTVACTFLYRFTADAYMIALFLSTLAVFITNKYKFGFIFGGIILGFVTGIYQAYFTYAISLMGLLSLLYILENQSTAKDILARMIKYLLSLIIGAIVYFILLKISLLLHHASLSNYQGVSEMGQLNISMIPLLVKNTYLGIFKFFFRGALVPGSRVLFLLYCLVFALIGFFMINLIKIQKIYTSKLNFFILVLVIISAPLWLNVITLTGPSWVHVLMIMSFVHVFTLLIALADMNSKYAFSNNLGVGNCIKKQWLVAAVYLSLITSSLLIYNYYILDHKIYLRVETQYENSYAFANRLVARMEETEGYNQSMPIALMGRVSKQPITKPEFDELNALGVIQNEDLLYSPKTYLERFINDWIGAKFVIATNEQKETLNNNETFQGMPAYPLKDSVKVINGILVIKL